MGDNGALYAGFTPEYVEKMRGLCREADYILPNVTEACYLANVPYPLNTQNAREAFQKLQTLCSRPIITGITDENGVSVCYANEQGKIRLHIQIYSIDHYHSQHGIQNTKQ
jgi:pyridoxine kinase